MTNHESIAPLMLWGVRHRANCWCLNTPAGEAARRPCNCGALLQEIERLRAALAAADVLAHQYVFSPFHERYWKARGHDACTVCVPGTVLTPLPVEPACICPPNGFRSDCPRHDPLRQKKSTDKPAGSPHYPQKAHVRIGMLHRWRGLLASGKGAEDVIPEIDIELRRCYGPQEKSPEKLAYFETHEPPHCPTCDCGMAPAEHPLDEWLAPSEDK